MNIDISLAGWILSVITFVLGTIVPAIFRRLSYQGVGIKQPFDIRAISQNPDDEKEAQLRFCTIIKIANAEKDSILMDEIRLSSPQIKDVRFTTEKDIHLTPLDLSKNITIPFSHDPEYSRVYFPLIIKADDEMILGLEIIFHYPQGNSNDLMNLLDHHIASEGLPVAFRINGKYRDYVLRIKSGDYAFKFTSEK